MKLRILIYAGLSVVLVLFFIWIFSNPSLLKSFPVPPPVAIPSPEIPQGQLDVHGEVSDPQDRGISNSWVQIVGDRSIHSTPCNAEGKFLLRSLREGSYRISAGAPGYEPVSRDFTTDESSLRLVLHPIPVYGSGPDARKESEKQSFVELTGRLLGDSCSPPGLEILLIPQNLAAAGGFSTAKVEFDGLFTLKNLTPGGYEIRVLSSKRPFDHDFFYEKQFVELEPGKDKKDVAIALSCMEISGKVLAPSPVEILPAPEEIIPVAGAPVFLYFLQENGSYRRVGWVSTDEAGRFTYSNLPLGNYRLEIFASGYKTLIQDMDPKLGSVNNLELILTSE